MKTNYIPAVVMLLAGAVYCLFGIRAGISLMDFTVQLLIVLFVFYVLGGIIKIVLDKFMGEIEDKTGKDTETSEKPEEVQPADSKNSEDEEGM